MPLQDVGSRGLARLEASGLAFWEKPKAEQGDDLPFSVGLRISNALKCRSRACGTRHFGHDQRLEHILLGGRNFLLFSCGARYLCLLFLQRHTLYILGVSSPT